MMFQEIVWFFDNASLAILCVVGFIFYRIAEALAKIHQTPIVFGVSSLATLAHFIHLYAGIPDASFASLWPPMVRALACGATLLGSLMLTLTITLMAWETHTPWILELARISWAVALWIHNQIKEWRRDPEPTPDYVPTPPPLPVPTRAECLTRGVEDAQAEFQDTVTVLSNVVSTLDEDESEEIEILARQKLVERLSSLFGVNNGRW